MYLWQLMSIDQALPRSWKRWPKGRADLSLNSLRWRISHPPSFQNCGLVLSDQLWE